jgi:hypothetical protein
VFWPILLLYFLALFFVTMKGRIKHMIKHKYLPFSTGKKRYSAGSALGGPPQQRHRGGGSGDGKGT